MLRYARKMPIASRMAFVIAILDLLAIAPKTL